MTLSPDGESARWLNEPDQSNQQLRLDFKVRAVQFEQPGRRVLVKDVAESLDIHPSMLSKWRKQVRDGELGADPPPEPDRVAVAELRRLRDVEKQFKRLHLRR